MRVAAALFALLAGACCTRLPSMPRKTTALPAMTFPANEAGVTREVWRDEKRDRDVPVTIYAPQHATGRLPVVVFSHGIGENRDSYAWLGRTLAQHGYLTVHVTHAGTDRAVLERGYRHLYRAVKEPQNWINRPLDVSFVLDRLASRSDADVHRTAAVGHSAGAFTAFALAGMRTVNGGNFRDARVKVAIPMSMPRLDGVVPPGGYDTIEVPLLNLTGTRDSSIIYRTFPRHRRIPFDQTHAARQYLVTLQGATHNSFVVEDKRRDAILQLTLAFLDAYLRDDRAARAWFDEAGRAELDGVAISVERKPGAAR
jgi:predicted dienelactone hydrolase